MMSDEKANAILDLQDVVWQLIDMGVSDENILEYVRASFDSYESQEGND